MSDNSNLETIWSNIGIFFIVLFVWFPCFLIACTWFQRGNIVHPVINPSEEHNTQIITRTR